MLWHPANSTLSAATAMIAAFLVFLVVNIIVLLYEYWVGCVQGLLRGLPGLCGKTESVCRPVREVRGHQLKGHAKMLKAPSIVNEYERVSVGAGEPPGLLIAAAPVGAGHEQMPGAVGGSAVLREVDAKRHVNVHRPGVHRSRRGEVLRDLYSTLAANAE
nr:hypothetical protein [Microbacterium sp. NIBRBAC000506063]